MDTTTAHVPALHDVTSFAVSGLGHRDGHLFIRFKTGKTYRYGNVSVGQFADLLQAGSKAHACQEFTQDVEGHPCCQCVGGDDSR